MLANIVLRVVTFNKDGMDEVLVNEEEEKFKTLR